MANSILKLRVESSEYDAKLKKAAEGIRHLAEVAHRGGGDLTGLEKAELDYIKALGDMETKSRSASGKVRELSNAYKELTVTYNELNDVEKADEGGKALAASLEKLRARAQEAQAQMDVATKSLQSNTSAGNEDSSMLSKLADKFTINIDAIKLFNVGLNAAKAALDVAKDAFFASEANVDEWGRTIEASKSVYDGFLTALNTGDISGFLSNINTIVAAAQEAYNELDRLSTQKAIDNPRMKDQQTENERFRAMLRTGRYIAPNDGRQASMAEGTKLTKKQLEDISRMLENGMKNTNSIIRSELDQTTKAINALYKEQATRLNMSQSEFMKGTSSMAEFDKRMRDYKKYLEYEQEHTYMPTAPYPGAAVRPVRDNSVNPWESAKAWGVFKDDGELFQTIQAYINQRASLQSQNYNNIAQAYRSINRAENLGGGGGGGKSGIGNEITYASDSIAAMEAEVSNLTKLWKEASAAVRSEYADALNEAKLRLDEVSGKTKLIAFDSEAAAKQVGYTRGDREGIMTSGLGKLTQLPTIGEGLSKETMDYIKNLQQGGNDVSKSWRTAASAISQVGGALSSIKNPAIDIMTVVGQAIATVALAYSQTLAKDATSKTNIFSFIAAAAAATVSMATTIAQIRANTGYAEGGIVKGNSYSGDNMMFGGDGLYGLNAGELVLTKAMQGNLASQLQGNGGGGRGGYTPSHVSGEQIWIALNAFTKRTGKGEVVTWR